MGRRSQGKKLKKLDLISPKQGVAMDYFVLLWTHLCSLNCKKAHFALHWIWKQEQVLHIISERLLGLPNCSRRLLYNGYRECREHQRATFSDSTWASIDDVFGDKLSLKHLPKRLVTMIDLLTTMNKPSLRALVDTRKETIHCCVTHLPEGESTIQLLPGNIRNNLDECFLGDWEREGREAIQSKLHVLCRSYPTEFIVVERKANITYLMDKSLPTPLVVAMTMHQSVLSGHQRSYIRTLMADLFVAHNKIDRVSHMALNSYMVGFGPFYNRWKREGGNKVSFYTHPLAVSELLRECNLHDQLGALVDRYAHGNLMNIILGLYLWWCPSFLESFVEYSKPHLDVKEYDSIELEKDLGIEGPSAYQLYITEDYCSEVHADRDHSEFTLCYASHPDADTTSPIDFVIADYGVRLPVTDGDLFAFRSNIRHGTGYRRPSRNRAYVGCVAITSRLNDLMARRQ